MEPHNRRTLGPGQPASILCGQGLALAGAVLTARRETKCEEEPDDAEQADHGWAGPGARGQQAIRSQLPSIRITKDRLGPTHETQSPARSQQQPHTHPSALREPDHREKRHSFIQSFTQQGVPGKMLGKLQE